MRQRPYETTSVAALERPGGWSPIRRDLGVRSLGVNAWTAHDEGAVVIPEHDEEPSGHEELYLVVAGHATFTVAGEAVDGPPGTLVFVRDPSAQRGAVARKPETTVLALGGKPGAVYRPRAWEVNAEVIALFQEGRHADAKARLEDALDRYDDRAALLYNLACAEALLGEVDAAFAHLAEAVQARPAFAASAREDDDLAPLRGDPRFTDLTL